MSDQPAADPAVVAESARPRRTFEETIAEIRRREGIARPTRPPQRVEPPPVPAPVQKRRRLQPWVVVAALLLVGGIGAGASVMLALVPRGMPESATAVARFTAQEQAAPGGNAAPMVQTEAIQAEPEGQPAAPAPAAAPRSDPVVRPAAPRVTPGRSSTGVGGAVLARAASVVQVRPAPRRAALPGAEPATAAGPAGQPAPLPAAPPAEPVTPPTPAALRADERTLPAGSAVRQALVAVRALPILSATQAGSAFLVVQGLPGGDSLQIRLQPRAGTGLSEPRVMDANGFAAGSMRFLGFMLSARARIAPDSLLTLLRGLEEVPPAPRS